jgi:hypothetical protein
MDEQPTPPAGRVVQTGPATRSTAIAATLLALLALGVVLIFARDRADAIVTSVLEALVWGGLVIFFQAARGTRPPLVIRPDELPQTVGQLKVVVRATVFTACFYAAAVAYSLDVHMYFTCGIAFGTPIVIWYSFRRAKQTEHELSGTLWAPARMALGSKGRGWFLVTDEEPADAVESWD